MQRSESTWLSLRAGLRDLILQEHHQPYSILDNLRTRELQYPQIIALIGQQTKNIVMRSLHFGPRYRDGACGEVQLRANPETIKHESPVLFADCEMHNMPAIPQSTTERVLGDINQHPLIWHRQIGHGPNTTQLAHLLYAKFLAPFTNIICFFADDLGGLAQVAQLLATWLLSLSSRSSDLPQVTHPRVLVLTRWTDYESFNEDRATRVFLYEVGRAVEKKVGILTGSDQGAHKKASMNAILEAQFGGLRVVALPNSESVPQWRALKARILRNSGELQQRRRNSQVLFSGLHFKTFLQMACKHFSRDVVSPFSFVKASRVPNPVPPEFQVHLKSFLGEISSSQVLNFAAPVIASAFLFDSYLTGMHFFHPTLVFGQFFQQICLYIDPLRGSKGQEHPQFTKTVEVSFCELAFGRMRHEINETEIHLKTLEKFQDLWKDFYSNKTCFGCLARAPEHALQCGHSLCSPCVSAFADSTKAEPWTFWLKTCPLCGESNKTKFLQKPYTAGVRALITEGGGVRGVVPLTFLKELEIAVGLPMDIQEHFDIAFGSSSGALITLGLFSNRWTVQECLEQFRNLSQVAFRKRLCFVLPVPATRTLQSIIEVFLSFVTDSRYSSKGITKALKAAFSENSIVFDSGGMGTKIGIVATTTADSATCLFTNYNGPESRPQDSGYRIVRPVQKGKEFKTWQAARASAAAPPYFSSFHGYQDGGLGGHTNPINLALWEQDTIWSRGKKQPDILVSLGTGFKRQPNDDQVPAPKNSFFRDRCIPRLFRSFLNFFVGERRWQELQNSLPIQARNRYHRMNIEFHDTEPDLDDVDAIESLQQRAQSQALSTETIKICADNLLASLFYIELTQIPTFDKTLFVCKGRICCRLGPSHGALRALTSRLKASNARFYFGYDQSVPSIDEDIFRSVEAGSPYVRPIVFNVLSLEDSIDIKIDGIIKRARSISNCPYVLGTLIKDQGLHCVFGNGNGKKRSIAQDRKLSKRVRFLDDVS